MLQNILVIAYYVHIVGQVIFGGYFVWSGINHFINYKGLTGYTASKNVPFPAFAVFFSGGLMILGGLGVMLDIYPLIALILLVIFLIPTTFVMHAFWKDTDPQVRMSNMQNFLKNLALLGAVLMWL